MNFCQRNTLAGLFVRRGDPMSNRSNILIWQGIINIVSSLAEAFG